MLEARKENKVYRIDERDKKRFLADGFDVYKDGKIERYSDKKMIKYQDHVDALAKNNAEISTLVEENETLKLKVAELEAKLPKTSDDEHDSKQKKSTAK